MVLNCLFFTPKQPFKNETDLEIDEYEVVQHVERYSMGNQEEQRFSYPVFVEKKKKN